ncbi:WD40 repeat-like protein [Anaeromyces robustus]|uniref:methylated diphthine methylhydrolase n=1 Tax=Anaeromyces robustus TaxID=1754192 RepID=A0A1Y1X1U1_9FUNG|nr:WD40 repeat-like protein [Anaeromyces robustus]|eukprot:ORX79588.1 WD40 repeat-like protein [Anaeromyces robustus]
MSERKVTYYTPQTDYEYKAVYCTDVVEFCPYQGLENYFVIGTYEVLESGGNVISEVANDLSNDNEDENEDEIEDENTENNDEDDENSIKRTGRLLFQNLEPVKDDSNKKKIKIHNVLNLNTAAIFDLKWSYQKINDNGYLGMADAVGDVTVYKLNTNGKIYDLTKVANTENTTNELCCSLDWSNRISSSINNMVVSRSNGYITLYDFNNSEIKQLDHWEGHKFEAWVASFDQWNPNIIYSGADDCLFKGWDKRATSAPTFVNKKHDAGVCCIQVNPHNEHIMATGSYDTYLNIWDKRNMVKPLIHYCTEGGVWKIKWHPKLEKKNYIAAACMYNGFHIFDIDYNSVGENAITEICSYDKHESIAYGVDWCQYNNDTCKNQMLGTCSFYDHLFHIWEMEPI